MGGNFSSQIPECPLLNFGEHKLLISNKIPIFDQCNSVLKNVSKAAEAIYSSCSKNKNIGDLPISLVKVEESQAIIQYLFTNLQKLNEFSNIEKELKIITTGRKKMIKRQLAQKHLGVVSVLRSCEKVFSLFFDETLEFWMKPIESCAYFISFTALYVETILVTVCIHPSFWNAAKEIIRRTSNGIDKFKQHVVSTRLSYIVASNSKLPKNDLTKTEITAMISFLEYKQKKQWYLEWDTYFVIKVGDCFPSTRSNDMNNDELVPWKYITTTDPYTSTLSKLRAFVNYVESCEKLYSDQFEMLVSTVNELKITLEK